MPRCHTALRRHGPVLLNGDGRRVFINTKRLRHRPQKFEGMKSGLSAKPQSCYCFKRQFVRTGQLCINSQPACRLVFPLQRLGLLLCIQPGIAVGPVTINVPRHAAILFYSMRIGLSILPCRGLIPLHQAMINQAVLKSDFSGRPPGLARANPVGLNDDRFNSFLPQEMRRQNAGHAAADHHGAGLDIFLQTRMLFGLRLRHPNTAHQSITLLHSSVPAQELHMQKPPENRRFYPQCGLSWLFK